MGDPHGIKNTRCVVVQWGNVSFAHEHIWSNDTVKIYGK
nr:MAG TPA: hypothetical protein [Caudoviricetes sp.]